MLFGAHESISGGHHNAFERAVADGCQSLQIFTKNANRWNARDLTMQDREIFLKSWDESKIGPVAAHDSYLINLASPKDELYEKSKKAFFTEMTRAEFLGLNFLIFHPGSHTGSGIKAGIERIVAALSELIDTTPGYKLKILVENTAGQGTSIGSTFQEVADILEGVGDMERMGVCYDTCHAFAAGYDIRTADTYDDTMRIVDDLLGIENVRVFHLNDATKKLGSRVDRHTQIGEGMIGKEGFKHLVNDRRFSDVPGILETPPLKSGEDSYKQNLAVLRKLVE
ncbi:MAG TPA: deoxyribonuclease IV [Euryarchaeota archaeon]|nr:deoxyribonuclease IV [Euryarchaeota archaeon]